MPNEGPAPPPPAAQNRRPPPFPYASTYVALPYWLGMGQNPLVPPATFNPCFVGIGPCKIAILSFKAHLFFGALEKWHIDHTPK